ncbi:transposase [Parabacteroides sp. PFB2-10]|uniref:transposase n=1 Tax=Parabacteroides sp. PFB2-10 TaxID=1742405 RepID=UPI0024758D8F|nr:transposase [Parabacteroides sp. PFB2-10]MDH6311832.1 transposase [Parabacteroides sp. PFB2-10]MDL2245369.1 transposase [Parabacteroides sp. OttesenSCG-928-J18]
MSIDETAPSRGDLFTILSNKDGHGRKGTIAATVRGTRSEDLITVFNRIPKQKRLMVKEVTMDFSDSMHRAVAKSFPNAEIVIDCFHIVQLATSAMNEIRTKHKRKAMTNDAIRRREHKIKLKNSEENRKRRQQEREKHGRVKHKQGRRALTSYHLVFYSINTLYLSFLQNSTYYIIIPRVTQTFGLLTLG